MAATDVPTTGTETQPGGASSNLEELLAGLLGTMGSGGGVSSNPWDVSYGMDSPVYVRKAAEAGQNVFRHGGTSAAALADAMAAAEAQKKPQATSYNAKDYQSDTRFQSGQEWIEYFVNKGPHEVSQLQNELATYGYLKADGYRPGDATDEGTQQALAGILRVAALKKIDPLAAWDYLKKMTPESMTLAGQADEKKKAAGQAASEAAYNGYLAELNSTYLRTWGVPPPPGYTDRAAKSQMNIYEFEAHERAKPAFEQSEQGQYERIGLESQVANWMGSG